MSKRLVIGGVAAIVVALYASPYWALYQLRKAVEAGDAVELNDRIDFLAVRESLKGTLSIQLTKSMGDKMSGNPFAGFATLLANGMVNSLVEQLVTPEAISNMVTTGRPKKADEPASSTGRKDDEGMRTSRGYRGWDRFELRVENANDPSGATFTLRRENLFFWRLKHIELKLPT